MKHFIFIITVVFAMSNHVPVCADTSVPIYLGTYTRGTDDAKGIYLTWLNSQDGSLTEPTLAAEVARPAFLAKHPTQPRLYSISESGQEAGSPIHAFAVDPATFALTKLNEQSVPVQGACHLGVFALPMEFGEPQKYEFSGKYAVVVACYSGGAVASLPLTDDGQLAPYASIHKHVGSGPTPRQQQPHAHAVYPFSPLGLRVAVPDLGADKLFFYWTQPDGKLLPDSIGEGNLELPPGSGPRHAAFASGTRSTTFILNELNSTISVATPIRSRGGSQPLELRQTISTLPEGKVVENNTAAAIFLHPNGRFLYASNRGDDSIALFHFDGEKRSMESVWGADGPKHPLHEKLLEFIETVPCGRHPRSFDISPDGKWLIVAAMHDDLVTTFRIDPGTGRLTPTGHAISIKQPACVLPIVMQTVEERAAIRALRLDKTETTDADLEKIATEYPNLVELTLSETNITDTGLAPLVKLTKLRKVRISKTAITDEAAKVLAQIPSLEDIDVSQTDFGDNGLKALQPLEKLKRLNLYTTEITDKGLAVLKDFKSRKTLIWLNIDRCSLTDEAISFLFPLENLEWLHLGRTRLTDTGLAELARVATLKEVSVTNTNVTVEGVKKFKSVLPECKVNENAEEKQHVAP